MTDIFVSYASEDRERVAPIVEALEQSGWSVWWDRRIGAGSAFDREIEKAIDDARCVIVVWSRDSVESEWVRTEANEGLEKGNLVPVSIDAVRPPLAFRRIQTIDFGAESAVAQIRDAVSQHVRPASQGTGDLTPFVGREEESRRAEDALARISDTEGRFLMIGGGVGVGKTRLVRELTVSARSKGLLVLTGHCLDMDGATPYQPLLEQIAQATRISRPENMRRSLGDNAPEVAKLMPELRQQFQDIPQTPELPPEQERRYLLNGVGDFIDRAARFQPMMLVFEDLHWADDSTCILLRHLAERLKESPVLMVGTYRDDELDPNRPLANTLRELTRERLAEEILLRPLDKDGVRAIIEGRARKTAPQELVDLVFLETDGNPFFVEEVFRHLDEVGKLFDDNGEFRAGVEIADTEVPRGVQLVIGERLGRVSDTCRTVLTTAAVAGRNFSFDLLLAASARLEEDDILDAIDDAVAAGLLVDTSREREARYSFVHEQIRQSLLMALSLPRRQRIHLRIAEALEQTLGERVREYAGELSYHLYQCGASADPEKTIYYLTEAGLRALESLAFEEALRRFDSALEIIGSNDQRAVSLLRRKAEALFGMGRIDDSATTLNEASATAEPAEQDAITLQRCRMLLDVWRGSEAVEDLEQLLTRTRNSGDREAELEAHRWLARAYYVMSLDRDGYADKVRGAYDETIALARELGNEKTLAHALTATAPLVDYDRSYLPTARAHLIEADEIGRRLEDEEIQIDVATAKLNAWLSDGTDQLGEDLLKKLLARRDPVRLNAHYFRMMWTALSAARLERCVEICNAGTELAYRIGTLPVQYGTIKAIALLELGRFDDALTALGEEVADEEHRFGAALQKLGEFQYLIECGAFNEAIDKTPFLIGEAKVLSRMWMLNWIAQSLSMAARYLYDEPHTVERMEALIGETTMPAGRLGRVASAAAHNDLETALQLSARLEDSMKGSITNVRPYLNLKELLAFILMRAGRHDEALAHITDVLQKSRDANMMQLHWRLLALKARAESDLGTGDSENTLAEASSIRSRIADTIADPAHREAFIAGPVSRAVGLADTPGA